MNTAIVPILFGVLGALIGALFSFRQIQEILRISRTPTTSISLLPPSGEVEVAGQVQPINLVRSPISQTECVLWDVEIKEKRGGGKNSRWVTIFRQTSTEEFVVQDDTGAVGVNPAGSNLYLEDDMDESAGFLSSLSSETLAALEALGVETKGFLGFDKTLKVKERRLAQGDQIYVLGEVLAETAQRTLGSSASKTLLLSDRSEKALLSMLYFQVAVPLIGGAFIGAVLTGFFK